MNKRMIVLASALVLFSPAAFADCGGGNGNNDNPSNGCNGQGGNGGNGGAGGSSVVDVTNVNLNGNSNANHNSNENVNQNTATGGAGGQSFSYSSAFGGHATGGNAKATGGSVSNSGNSSSSSTSSSGGNTISVVNTDSGALRYSGSYRVKSVPTAYTPNAYPTAPCIVGVSAGGSGVGFGVSFGAGKKDLDCTRRENARRLTEQGEVVGATALMCQDADIYRAMKRQCDIAIAAGR